MNRVRVVPGHGGSPALRGAARSQIVAHGLVASEDIAAELAVPHATVVRVLQTNRYGGGDASPRDAGASAKAMTPASEGRAGR
jgi:hypothetical protein